MMTRSVRIGLYRTVLPGIGECARVDMRAGDAAPYLERAMYELLDFKPSFEYLPQKSGQKTPPGNTNPPPLPRRPIRAGPAQAVEGSCGSALVRIGTGRRSRSISCTSCALRRSSRSARCSASTARFSRLALCIASATLRASASRRAVRVRSASPTVLSFSGTLRLKFARSLRRVMWDHLRSSISGMKIFSRC